MKMIRRLTVDLLQSRAPGVAVEVPYVIRYMFSFSTLKMTLCFVILYSLTYLLTELNSGLLAYKGYVTMIISLLFSFVVFTFYFLR